jgi:hypothetical protein
VPLGQRQRPAAKKGKETEKAAPRAERPLALPEANNLPALGEQERRDFADRLARLAGKVGSPAPTGPGDKELGTALVELDRRLDAMQGDKRPARKTGALAELGPPRRRLMALAWKHGVEEYADVRLNAVELLERLEKKLRPGGAITEGPP